MLATLAVRLGAHPRRTLLVALAVVIVAGVVGGPVAGQLKGSGGFAPGNSPSQVAIRQLEAATGTEPNPGIVLLVATPNGPVAAAGRIAELDHRLTTVPGVVHVRAPAGLAVDQRHVLIAATLRANASDKASAKAALRAFAGDRDVTVGGTAVGNEQVNAQVTKDLGMAELLAFPLLVVLSILFFRGRAALMPLAVGLTTVLTTFLVLFGVNHVYGLSVFALNLVIGMGLGLSIDYTLFLVTRYREELDRTPPTPTPAAIATTVARAGHTIVFSALTVACAMATLIVFPQGFLKSMGIAGAITALVAAATALTISPALLGLWNLKLARRRSVPGSVRADRDGRWYRFAHAVMRHPGPVALVTAVVMLAVALPALGAVWTPATDGAVIPKGQSARTVADAIARDFRGADTSPVTVAIVAPASDHAAVGALAQRIGSLQDVTGVRGRYLGRSTWELDASVAGDPSAAPAQRVVHAVRAVPTRFAKRVTGDAATFVDQQDAISSHLPITIGLLVVLTFLILWLMTDSVVLPLKAIVMNALTVGAALSPLILIYQHGNLSGLLHYTPDGGVEPTDFVVAATLVFALSTDYGVFLLGRIKEARETRPGDEREAVAAGLSATGRVITAAAILLAVAIGAFSTSSISFIQQIGVSVAAGVLLDAFVVRSLLVPSLMALLGRANWWSPSPMRRMRRRIVSADRGRAAAPAV